MFKIDLLKGEGLPAKSRPECIAISAVTVVVPVMLAAILLGYFFHGKAVIAVYQSRINQCEKKIEGLSEAVQLRKSFESEKTEINTYLSEVAEALSMGIHTQWSPILVAVVENIPASVVLTDLNTTVGSVRRKVPKKNDPKKTVSINIPVRTLQMSVTGATGTDCDRDVREFRDKLYASDILGPKLDTITVSRKMDIWHDEGDGAISYQIDCVFKPGL